jgi:hypothetical protein
MVQRPQRVAMSERATNCHLADSGSRRSVTATPSISCGRTLGLPWSQRCGILVGAFARSSRSRCGAEQSEHRWGVADLLVTARRPRLSVTPASVESRRHTTSTASAMRPAGAIRMLLKFTSAPYTLRKEIAASARSGELKIE